jgi:hypothetical protein
MRAANAVADEGRKELAGAEYSLALRGSHATHACAGVRVRFGLTPQPYR